MVITKNTRRSMKSSWMSMTKLRFYSSCAEAVRRSCLKSVSPSLLSARARMP